MRWTLDRRHPSKSWEDQAGPFLIVANASVPVNQHVLATNLWFLNITSGINYIIHPIWSVHHTIYFCWGEIPLFMMLSHTSKDESKLLVEPQRQNSKTCKNQLIFQNCTTISKMETVEKYQNSKLFSKHVLGTQKKRAAFHHTDRETPLPCCVILVQCVEIRKSLTSKATGCQPTTTQAQVVWPEKHAVNLKQQT